jgi:hypothetical protein
MALLERDGAVSWSSDTDAEERLFQKDRFPAAHE